MVACSFKGINKLIVNTKGTSQEYNRGDIACTFSEIKQMIIKLKGTSWTCTFCELLEPTPPIWCR